MLNIKKRSNKNLILAVKKIRDIVESKKKTFLPSDIEIEISNDQSSETINLVNDLTNNIIFGVILVITVLMFFLDWEMRYL